MTDRSRRRGPLRLAVWSIVLALGSGCGGDAAESGSESDDATPAPYDSAAALRVAENVVAFLRGQAPFDAAWFADSVALRVAPEGGGAARVFGRDELAALENWRVDVYSFLPPDGLSSLTLQPGTHFNCFEVALATRSDSLARLPHVGARLEQTAGGSCLQTWNLTLVFAAGTSPPRVSAAVYDQFEW